MDSPNSLLLLIFSVLSVAQQHENIVPHSVVLMLCVYFEQVTYKIMKGNQELTTNETTHLKNTFFLDKWD